MVKKLLFILLASCTPQLSSPNSQFVYNELVDSGCLSSGDASFVAVQAGTQSDAQPPWFSCLFDGGTIASCGVPCGDK
jgi:hypothetical protein